MSQEVCPLCGERAYSPGVMLTAELISSCSKEMLYAIAAGVPLEALPGNNGKSITITTRYPVAFRYDHNGMLVELVKVPR